MIKTLQLFCYLIALCPFINQAQIQFSPYVAIPTGSWPEVVAIGDVNNDGLNDVVLGTRQLGPHPNNFKILVFIQNASGNLNTPIAYGYDSTLIGVTSIDIADLNHDNLNDVVIGYDSKFGIYYQNASGSLNAISEINPNMVVSSLKTADLNSDGLTDIIVASGYNNTFIKIYYQTASNVFSEISYAAPNFYLGEVEIGDINNDGKDDILCMSDGDYMIYVYYQNSSGTFNPYTSYYVFDMNAIAVGDLNNDGRKDVAVAKGGNSPNAKVALLIQNPITHLLNSPTERTAFDIPESIEIADLNNDGKNEIIAAHGGWLHLSVYQQNSSNVFTTYTSYDIPYASHYNTQGFDIGDINHDGTKDVAIADSNNGLVILYNVTGLGTAENSLKANVVIYPNPATDYLNIENKTEAALEYEITDTNGKLLQTAALDDLSNIDVRQLQTGLYFLILKSEQERATYKFLKN